MASFYNSSELHDEDEQGSEAIEDTVAHMVQIDMKNYEDVMGFTENANCQESSFLPARIDNEDEPASFKAQLQNASLSHATVASITKKRFGEEFKRVLVDTSPLYFPALDILVAPRQGLDKDE